MYIVSDCVELPESVETRTSELIIYPKGDPRTNPGSYGMRLCRVRPDEIAEMKEFESKEKISGLPTLYAVLLTGEKPILMLWPRPDTRYYAEFFYNPPMKRI